MQYNREYFIIGEDLGCLGYVCQLVLVSFNGIMNAAIGYDTDFPSGPVHIKHCMPIYLIYVDNI